MSTKRKIIISTILIFSIFAMVIIAALVFGFVVDRLQKRNTAETPIDTAPIVIQVPQGPNLTLVSLLKDDYTPSADVFSNLDTYKRESIKLALTGEFAIAELKVSGTVLDDEENFVMINFGSETGILNGVRIAKDRIDISETNERGGLFTRDLPIEFVIDLLGSTSLATNNDQFINTRQGSKVITFWNYLLQPPPTVARLLIAPFDKFGKYGNAKIESIELRYFCEKGSPCNAGVCLPNGQESESKCINRLFGDKDEAVYKKSVGLKE